MMGVFTWIPEEYCIEGLGPSNNCLFSPTKHGSACIFHKFHTTKILRRCISRWKMWKVWPFWKQRLLMNSSPLYKRPDQNNYTADLVLVLSLAFSGKVVVFLGVLKMSQIFIFGGETKKQHWYLSPTIFWLYRSYIGLLLIFVSSRNQLRYFLSNALN